MTARFNILIKLFKKPDRANPRSWWILLPPMAAIAISFWLYYAGLAHGFAPLPPIVFNVLYFAAIAGFILPLFFFATTQPRLFHVVFPFFVLTIIAVVTRWIYLNYLQLIVIDGSYILPLRMHELIRNGVII